MSANMVEVRVFLAGVAGQGAAPGRIPQMLHRVVRGAARRRFDPDDLLQDLLADLIARSRSAQPGGITELLKLPDAQLIAALRCRIIQASATAGGSRWKTVKLVRERVRAALRNGLTPDEIKEVLLQAAIYCGVPAANRAFAIAQEVLAEG